MTQDQNDAERRIAAERELVAYRFAAYEANKLSELAKWLVGGNAAVAALATAFGTQTLELHGRIARTLFDFAVAAFALSAVAAVISLVWPVKPEDRTIVKVAETRRRFVAASAVLLALALVAAACLYPCSRYMCCAKPFARIQCSFNDLGALVATWSVEDLKPDIDASLTCVHTPAPTSQGAPPTTTAASQGKTLHTLKGRPDRNGKVELRIHLPTVPAGGGTLTFTGDCRLADGPFLVERTLMIPLP